VPFSLSLSIPEFLSSQLFVLLANRLANFIVGVSNIDPEAVAPTPLTYTSCASQASALGAYETESLQCEAKGRYVIVQIKRNEYLTLCEVVVLGSKSAPSFTSALSILFLFQQQLTILSNCNSFQF
jgi:hypothetical protein